MKPARIRILSDLHFGDRASVVGNLDSLRPLMDGADALLLNGDTMDTRPGGGAERTAGIRSEVRAFFSSLPIPATLLSGNHDPDIGGTHFLDLAEGRVLLTHGDIVFEDIVPWSRDAALVKNTLAEEMEGLSPSERGDLEPRLAAYRRAALRIPQRHQGETDRLKHALAYLRDTVWPPLRLARVLRAWNRTPALADAALARHRPRARFLVMGHTHRAGVWSRPRGSVIVNTGSYCHPFGAAAVDLEEDRLHFRRILRKGGEFRLGAAERSLPLG